MSHAQGSGGCGKYNCPSWANVAKHATIGSVGVVLVNQASLGNQCFCAIAHQCSYALGACPCLLKPQPATLHPGPSILRKKAICASAPMPAQFQWVLFANMSARHSLFSQCGQTHLQHNSLGHGFEIPKGLHITFFVPIYAMPNHIESKWLCGGLTQTKAAADTNQSLSEMQESTHSPKKNAPKQGFKKVTFFFWSSAQKKMQSTFWCILFWQWVKFVFFSHIFSYFFIFLII